MERRYSFLGVIFTCKRATGNNPLSLIENGHATLRDMISTPYTELPVRFQRVFVSVAALFLIIYCGGIIYQQLYFMQHWDGDDASWAVVAAFAKTVLPAVLFIAGARLSSGAKLWRSMVGMLCAIAGVFAQTTLSYGLAFVSSSMSLSYDAVEIGAALATIMLGMAALFLVFVRPRLRRRWHMIFSVFVIALAIAQVGYGVVALLGVSSDMTGVLLPMILAHLIVLGLSLLAYFLVRRLARSDRVFRATLTIMTAMMAMLSVSFATTAAVQLGWTPMQGADTLYTILDIAVPLLIYIAAVWTVRPPQPRLKPVKFAK